MKLIHATITLIIALLLWAVAAYIERYMMSKIMYQVYYITAAVVLYVSMCVTIYYLTKRTN